MKGCVSNFFHPPCLCLDCKKLPNPCDERSFPPRAASGKLTFHQPKLLLGLVRTEDQKLPGVLHPPVYTCIHAQLRLCTHVCRFDRVGDLDEKIKENLLNHPGIKPLQSLFFIPVGPSTKL